MRAARGDRVASIGRTRAGLAGTGDAGGPAARIAALLARRLLQALAAAIGVAVICFLLVESLPGDAAFRVAAARYGYDLVSATAADAVRAELGLDGPRWRALVAWLADLARLEFGVSVVNGRPVLGEVLPALGHSVTLALAGLALAIALGAPLGVAAGMRPGGWIDSASTLAAVVLRALPSFVLGLALVIVFALQLGALPAAGHGERGSIVLPAVTLGIPLAAMLARVVRDSLADAIAAPWFAFALAKGLPMRVALARHAARNVAAPLSAWLGVQLVLLVEGVVVVEAMFAWPGIGHALVHAVFARDVPMLQGAALAMGFAFVLVSTAVDLAGVAIDPRRRER